MHPQNAKDPIVFKLSGSITLYNSLQHLKA